MESEKDVKFNIALDNIEPSPVESPVNHESAPEPSALVTPAPEPSALVTPAPEPSDLCQAPEPIPYVPSAEDIAFLQKQVTISSELATQLLLKNNGNYVNAIVDFYQVKYTPDTIGIAESSHKQLDISGPQNTETGQLISRVLTLDTLRQCQLNTIPRTYLYVVLNNNYNGFTKKKKYGTLADMLTELVEPGIRADIAKYDILAKHVNQTLPINIRELTGNCTEVLDKWSLPSAGIAFYPGQVFANKTVIELGLIGFLNKNGTQLARYSGIIQDTESIIGEAYVISNVEFN